MGEYWSRMHFWWKDILEGPHTHDSWPEVFRSYGRYEERNGDALALAGGTSVHGGLRVLPVGERVSGARAIATAQTRVTHGHAHSGTDEV